MEHFGLEVFDRDGLNGQFMNLPKNASLTLTLESPLFGSGNVCSFPFQISVAANLHIIGSAGDLHGARLHEQLDRRRARLWVEGLPLYYGYIRLDSEATMADGMVDLTFSSGRKTFEERIEGGKANQVPLLGDVLLGMALWRPRRTQVVAEMEVAVKASGYQVPGKLGTYAFGSADITEENEQDQSITTEILLNSVDGAQWYPKYVMPYGLCNIQKSDTINTDEAYFETEEGAVQNPYCNIAICYQKMGYERTEKDGTKVTDYSQEPVAQRGYELAPADRVNTAPCFFVMYWLRALFKHLNIVVDENQMMGVQDLRRLFFVNTKCAYDVPKTCLENDTRYNWSDFVTLTTEYPLHYDNRRLATAFVPFILEDRVKEMFLQTNESQINTTKVFAGLIKENGDQVDPSFIEEYGDPRELVTGYSISIKALRRPYEWFSHENTETHIYYPQGSGDFLGYPYGAVCHRAYATSENFPDVEITTVIEALENGFGVRFVFDENYQRVRIVLLRNILRSNEVQEVACEVIGKAEKQETNIKGFRMTYGGGDDTAFVYKPFRDALPSGKKAKEWVDKSDTHDYSQMKTDSSYEEAKQNVTAFNKTCYVAPVDGNAYGVKVDKDAKRYNEQFPSLFEFAGYMDAEDGDCSDEEEETVKEIQVGFTPAITNDVFGSRKDMEGLQCFALLVDEEMQPRRWQLSDRDCDRPDTIYPITELYKECFTNTVAPWNEKNRTLIDGRGEGKLGAFSIYSDMHVSRENLGAMLHLVHYDPQTHRQTQLKMPLDIDIEGWVNEGYKLYLQDNYKPNDDGIAPIETHDWGLTLGIMRGSGSDAKVDYSRDTDENEGNDTWEVRPGSSATAHPDTCDDYGQQWDYNGREEGVGSLEGRVSLKLRAEKPNPDFDPSQPESDTNRRYLEITDPLNQRRGLMDQFHTEESFWWRNARVAKQPCKMEIATLKSIDLMKRVRIGDITGFVKRMTVPISIKTGLGTVEVEEYYL